MSPEPRQPNLHQVYQNKVTGEWMAPFIMAPINSKSVHRTNYLLDYRYGDDFTYEEMFRAGTDNRGRNLAKALAEQKDIIGYMAEIFSLFEKDMDYPAFYEIELRSSARSAGGILAIIRADHDPGYVSTAHIATETAFLLLEASHSALPGGIWTPTAAFGMSLVERLAASSSMSFALMTE